MAETNATILIPDISGFTAFMTNTELSHASHAINMLIDAMLEAIGEEYELSEIEGDALLLIKKGEAPSQKQVSDTCLKIFNAFHFQRKWIQQHAICPCGACQNIIDLTLKFVAHHGPVAEIKAGRFIKQSGTEMIVAHRLLKNNIANHEYLLVTEKLLQAAINKEVDDMDWAVSSEEYPSIGKIDYRFTLLNEARKNVPEPPEPKNYYRTDNTSFLEIPIAANFRDVYMVLMNIPGRSQWQTGLQKVEQDRPEVFVGSIHRCSFENYQATLSPLRMTLATDRITYAESCHIEEMNVSLVHEFICKKLSDTTSSFASRLLNGNDAPLPDELRNSLFNKLQLMAERLKEYCENMQASLFEPAFQASKLN